MFVPPLTRNSVIPSSKQSADPLGYRLVGPRLLDNVITRFRTNNGTDAKKTDVNLAIARLFISSVEVSLYYVRVTS